MAKFLRVSCSCVAVSIAALFAASPAPCQETRPGDDLRLLVPNCDDDDGDGVADAEDAVINGDADLADLLEIGTASSASDASSRFTIEGRGRDAYRLLELKQADGRIRVFVEATRRRSPGTQALVVEKRSEAGRERRLETPIDVRPFAVCSAIDAPTEVFVVEHPQTKSFVDALRGALAPDALRLTVFNRLANGDRWVQDTAEFGYFVGASMSVALKGMRGRFQFYSCAELDAKMAAAVTAPNRGLLVAGEPRKANHYQDWFGNLEAFPPHTGPDGVARPHGRIIVGRERDTTMHVSVLRLFEEQGVQWPPITLDVGFLQIAHVDEVINFVPCKTARLGFKVLLASPAKGRALLEELSRGGHGDAKMLEGKARGEITVDRLLADEATTVSNAAAVVAMQKNRELLARETGLTDADIIDVPVYYRPRGIGVWPGGVNGVTLGSRFLVPRVFGPMVDGKDAIESVLTDSLRAAGVEPVVLDCYEGYSAQDGQIHCGTNVARIAGR